MGYSQDMFMKESTKALNNIALIFQTHSEASDLLAALVEELERRMSEQFD